MNPLAGLEHMLGQSFLLHAVIAATAVAIASGLVGYFLVLRSQVFTVDALSHVAFTGALIALTIGADARVGLFVATVGLALVLGVLGRERPPDDVVIGSTFAWVMGIGVLALSVFTTSRSTGNGTASVHVLFGSLYGLDASATWTAVLVAAGVIVVTIAVARPLLFASVDRAVAGARGVPVRVLTYVFLVLVGATAAEATQAVGALLLLGLVAGPAGIALRLTARPFRAMVLTPAIAVVAAWTGLALSYAAPRLPPSFSIIAVIAGGYGVAMVATRSRSRSRYSAMTS